MNHNTDLMNGGPGLITHDWIERSGGAEKVLDAVASLFPAADMLTLWNDAPNRFVGRTVRESWLARTPARRHKAASLVLMPGTWRTINTRAYRWILASTHLFAHHVPASRDTIKLAYVHTPARYIWNADLDERGNSPAARMLAPSLRRLDKTRAAELDEIAANSEYVRSRIANAWERDSVVINPPVDVTRLGQTANWSERVSASEAKLLESLPDTFVVGASRFVAYKRLESVISLAAANNVPAVIAGSGPLLSKLTTLADDARIPVTVIENPSDALLYALIQRAIAFAFPPIEDFGILPVEAMALGTPAIVNREGGAAESVLDGKTGAHIDDWRSTEELIRALESTQSCSSEATRDRARAFSRERFELEVSNWVRKSTEV